MSPKITPEQRRYWAQKLGGLSEQYLYQCLTGRREMSPAEARRIEQESAGVLTRQMLCQKTWQKIWPELAPDSSKIALAAPETAVLVAAISVQPGALRAAGVRRQSARRAQVASATVRDRRAVGSPPFQSLETGVA